MPLEDAVKIVEGLHGERVGWGHSEEAEALALVIERVREPRVYALGEEERKELAELLENAEYELSEVRHYADPRKHDDVIRSLERQVHALTAALALQEPFTVEECKRFGQWAENLDVAYWANEDSLLLAKLRAYIEGRKAQSE